MQFSPAGCFCQIRLVFVYVQIHAKPEDGNAGPHPGFKDQGGCLERVKTQRQKTPKSACLLRAALLFFPALNALQKCRAHKHAPARQIRDSGQKAGLEHARPAGNQGYVLGNWRAGTAASARLPPTAHVNTSSTPTPRLDFIRYGSKCWCSHTPDIPFQSHEVCNEQ